LPMRHTISRTGLVLMLVMSAHGAAMARQAVVNTTVCEPVADGAAIVLVPAEDSPLNVEIGRKLQTLLERAGYRIADGAGLELRYQARKKALRGPVQDRTIGQLGGGSGGVAFSLKLWSTTKDSVLGGRQPQWPRRFETYLIMTMELDRHRDGACVWRGEAGASLVDWRDGELAARLARLLVDAFGKPVRLQSEDLD